MQALLPPPDGEVPADFPHEFVGAVAGAQPKLLVSQDSHGRYVETAATLRADRWAICVDLREQLVDYVVKRLGETPEPLEELLPKVGVALKRKRAGWSISEAEADWILRELGKRFASGVG